MRKLARFLTITAMALLIVMLVLLFGVNVQVVSVERTVLSGPEHEARITELVATSQRDDMSSDLFKRPLSTDFNDYQLTAITVTLKNVGIIPAQWARVTLTPSDYDDAQFTNGARDILPFGALTVIETTVLSDRGAPEPEGIRLEYYRLGRLMELGLTQ